MQHATQTMPASIAGLREALTSDPLLSVIMADTCEQAHVFGFAAFRDTGLPWLDGVVIEDNAATEVGYALAVIRAIWRGDVEEPAEIWRHLFEQIRLAWLCHVAEINASAWYRESATMADLIGDGVAK